MAVEAGIPSVAAIFSYPQRLMSRLWGSTGELDWPGHPPFDVSLSVRIRAEPKFRILSLLRAGTRKHAHCNGVEIYY